MTIFEKLKLVRTSSQMTQEQFAKAIGISRGNLANIELGKVIPTPLFINCVCLMFDVSKEWLTNDNDNNNNNNDSDINTLNQRLKEVRKSLGFNQTDFAKHLGITQTAYSMIENSNRPLADKYIKVICSTFNVSENWMLTGYGEMFTSSPYEKEFTEIFSNLTTETQEYLLTMARELLKTQKKLLKSDNDD